MINIIPADQQVFESILRSYENVRQGPDGTPGQAQMAATLEALATIVRGSDLVQKVLTIVELQVLRSNNQDSLASALLTFMMLGAEIGATLYQQRGAELIAPVAAADTTVN